ncbi:MAG TPA: ATP-binding protein [Spirochaetota bacterium]|nr:ATP-binding protein [Spirochaetota bacterium]
MKISYTIKLQLLLIPDILIAGFLLYLYYARTGLSITFIQNSIAGAGIFLLLKQVLLFFSHRGINYKIKKILSVISDYKKGKFTIVSNNVFHGTGFSIVDDAFVLIHKELGTMGKHLENLVSSQKSEIENLRELYHNIVLSISSYFIVLNEKQEIIFANESFCRKFQMELDEIAGKQIDDIFIFLTSTILENIQKVIITHESVILEKTHLVSTNKISIIADIKLSTMRVRGENQIIFVIDDVTNICKKDFQMNLISQVSESIQRDDEIDSVIHALLTGVTSGSGLGFNRAMLFMVDVAKNSLQGKMAVGPDTLEEAIEIWSSVSSCEVDIYSQLKSFNEVEIKGKNLVEAVQQTSFSLDDNNIFTQSFLNRESIHVYDAGNDSRVNDEVRKFMDVREFVVTPLVSVNKAIGVIIADNKFNQTPISADNIELLSIFSFQATLLIESYNNLHMIKKEMQKIRDRQEAMLESEKLAAVGRIASHIAHEIRNPLVTMGGYARRIVQLTKDSGPKSSERISSAAQVVLKESERLEKTLSNVMDFSRSSTFIMEFNNINEIIEDTYDLLKNLFQERRITISMDLDNDLPLVKSDFNQMKQVMLNLFQNAIDATPPEGKIDVITEHNDENLYIHVSDTGSGIANDDIASVFEPFFTTKVTGVGLGLAITKKIITDHNGEISASNRKGGGSTFTVTLKLPK